ncbi:hypothetical protein J5N97_017113 [Dioscorea zingiberensis]|uniref:Triosephosphate isomerase n=1 Tax=Dioscorea zingiberensis TaxID=325984 RepID=A0A9D5CKN2_9LILI|nr:hypothetical protein J5N97_017113 [Dioscorea zingiberensis]
MTLGGKLILASTDEPYCFTFGKSEVPKGLEIAIGTTTQGEKATILVNSSEDVVEVVVGPPYVFLPLVKTLLRSDFNVAAQNCWVRKGGAFTGEISAEMLVNLNIPWVILGHSESRQLLGMELL